MNTVFGYRETGFLSPPADLSVVLREFVAAVSTPPPFSDEAFVEAADNPVAYRAELASRLAYLPLLEDIDLVLDAEGSFPPVLVDRERFCDEVAGVLEDMAAAGAREIRLALRRERNAVGLLIRGGSSPPSPPPENPVLPAEVRALGSIACDIRGRCRPLPHPRPPSS
ncbi:hypothetical protein [Methanoculleus chikugoensis]|uniref:hypothetical protein n=1 Tax=Methanoculleus chikugoensis TaxID=118126 RepID=UPI0006D1348C|nr:hypothetical protein [Methanoculleus chikugoensis]